jgi:hypothetical protein
LLDARLLFQSILSIHKNRLVSVYGLENEEVNRRTVDGKAPRNDPHA